MPSDATRSMVIAGSSGDIGSYLVRHFLAEEWTVIGLDQRDPAPDAPAELVFRRCDLADAGMVAGVIDELAGAHGPCDVLVNCAGLIANSPLVRLEDGRWTVHDASLWDRVIAACLTSAFNTTGVVVKHMLAARKKGLIVNISSISAKGSVGQVAYSAAKAGLDGLTRTLARELGPLGIRVVGVAPGYVDTGSTRNNVPAPRLAKVVSAVPIRRLGQVSEIAAAVAFVIANEYVNGTILEVDGGLVL
jgi:3-oxoacyl-[acyl-carrier protein] reductase